MMDALGGCWQGGTGATVQSGVPPCANQLIGRGMRDAFKTGPVPGSTHKKHKKHKSGPDRKPHKKPESYKPGSDCKKHLSGPDHKPPTKFVKNY